jgi:hypothetical protein
MINFHQESQEEEEVRIAGCGAWVCCNDFVHLARMPHRHQAFVFFGILTCLEIIEEYDLSYRHIVIQI